MNLKSEVILNHSHACNLDLDKLKTIPPDLSKLSNVVDNNVVKKLCMIN